MMFHGAATSFWAPFATLLFSPLIFILSSTGFLQKAELVRNSFIVGGYWDVGTTQRICTQNALQLFLEPLPTAHFFKWCLCTRTCLTAHVPKLLVSLSWLGKSSENMLCQPSCSVLSLWDSKSFVCVFVCLSILKIKIFEANKHNKRCNNWGTQCKYLTHPSTLRMPAKDLNYPIFFIKT